MDFIESHFDPRLIDCSCRTCSRGGRCKQMAAWFDEYEQRQTTKALTPEDRTWLRAHGWSG